MSVCWQFVCDESKEKLWCGQNEYMYVGEKDTMRDLQAFLYRNRDNTFRIHTDLHWGGPEDDYLEVGILGDEWAVYAYKGDEIQYLGVFGRSRREALCKAAALYFPDVLYSDIVNVLHCHVQLAVSQDIKLDSFQHIFPLRPGDDNKTASFIRRDQCTS